MRPVKIAQLGIGHNHGQGKMLTVRKHPELFEVVGVAEPDAYWRAERGDLPVYEGLPFLEVEELLDTPGLEAVLVEPDVKDLMSYALLCARRGIAIHLDKPAGERYEDFEAVVNEARRHHSPIQMAYMYRYNDAVRQTKAMADRGELGTLTHMDAHMSTEHPAEYRRWLEQFRAGNLYIFGSHLIDLMVWFLGEPDAVTPFLTRSGLDGTTAVDNAAAVLSYGTGPSIVRVSSLEPGGYGRRQLVVCGTGGSVEIKPLEMPTRMTLAKAGTGHIYEYTAQELPVEGVNHENRYDSLMEDFAEIVRGKPNPFGYEYELMSHRTILRACGLM